MRGIILAGGLGTRLHPVTFSVSKQLLPVYDKPLIYYPLSTLMLAGIREICVISTPAVLPAYQSLLQDGRHLGISIQYLEQKEPKGIPESFVIAKDFLKESKCALILGDNIFHGPGLGRKLSEFREVSGAQVFGYHVSNPESYGVAAINAGGGVVSLEEKPKKSLTNIAIPGLYFLDEEVVDHASNLRIGPRGEFEIIELLEQYRTQGKLTLEMLPRGTAWFDCGTFKDLHDASTYVRLMEERTGENVGSPEEVAKRLGWT